MEITTLEPVLAEHPFLRDLPSEDLATIVGCARNETFPAGSFLFRMGAPADRFFVVRQGRVALGAHSGGREMTVLTVEEGDVLGWSWLFPPYRCHFDAQALTLVRAISLDAVCLRKKAEQDPLTGYRLMSRFAQVAIQRFEATLVQLMDLYGR